jgi:uroporphyrinogen-III synthase
MGKTNYIMKKINKILISQPRPLSDRNPYADMSSEFGVQCDFFQLIKVEGIGVREFREQHIYLEEYTAVIVNSRLGIDHYFRMAEEMRFSVPESMHYYCISEAIGNYLQKYIQYRKRKVFVAENNRFEDLLPAMHRRPQEKYLMVMSDVHNDETLNMFAENNVVVKPAVMYRTVATEWPADKPFDYDMIVLFTPSGVAALKKNFPDWQQEDTVIACFGVNTLAAAEEAGLRVDIKAPSEKYPSITTAIKDFLESQQE